jgi:hypothetical protein
MSTLSLRLPKSLHERARALAQEEGVSINQLIAMALAGEDGLSGHLNPQGPRTACLLPALQDVGSWGPGNCSRSSNRRRVRRLC